MLSLSTMSMRTLRVLHIIKNLNEQAKVVGALRMASSQCKVNGTVEPGFESVRALLETNINRGLENNVQVCAYHKGVKVVDLWATGVGDLTYGPDTLQNVFSSTKTVTAIVFAMGVDRGFLDYDKKVTDYWPEFEKNGKGFLTVADVLRHEAGLAAFEKPLEWEAIQPENIKANSIGQVIEDARQHFPPKKTGSSRQYHSMTRGWILNEIFRRAEPTGRTVGQFLREEIAKPLNIDVIIGAQGEELERYSDLQGWGLAYVAAQSIWPAWMGRKIEPNFWQIRDTLNFFISKIQWKRDEDIEGSTDYKAAPGLRGCSKIFSLIERFNKNEARTGEAPSVNGSCSARGLGKLAACILNGGEIDGTRILSKEAVDKMLAKPKKSRDYGFREFTTEFTQGGVNIFKMYEEESQEQKDIKSMNEGFIGWFGMGGSIFQWNPQLDVAFAFTPNLLHWFDVRNVRSMRYLEEVVKCVKNKASDE